MPAPARNHRIAIKTCQNFKYNHFARLVHCCDEILKDYQLMSTDIVTGKDNKANKWVRRYANVAGKRTMIVDTPEQMIKQSDAIILFGVDPMLERLASMASYYNVTVFRFTLY